MKRAYKASHQVHLTESCACHPKQGDQEQHAEHLNQEKERQQVGQECGASGVAQGVNRFFALSSDILSIVGFDGYFKCLSSASEKILGFSQEELLAQPFLEFVHPNDRAATVAVVEELAAGEQVNHFENRYRCKDGSYKWLSWSGIAVVEEELIYCTARDITENKQATETLQQSKQYYESLIHSLNGIVWEFDLQTQQFLFVSQKAEEILGYPIEQWLTEPHFWENHIHPDDRERAIHACHQLVLQKQDGQLEYRMLAADGSLVWIHDIVTLVIEVDQPVKLRGVLTDITELQQTKEILHRREQEFRALVENSPDVIARVDRNFRYLYINPRIEERTGISPAHCIGKTNQELGFPDDLILLWQDAAQRVFDTQQEQWLEFEIDSPSGRIFNHSRLVPEIAADGLVESVLVVVRDITEHKQLETALHESEARFQAFMQYTPIAAWIADTDGRMLYVNPCWTQILQVSAEEVIGQSLFDILTPELAQQYFDNNNWVLQSNQMIECVESAPQTDGSLSDYLVYKFPIERPDGCRLVGGVAVDITELKRTEAALRESEERFRQIAESIGEVFWVTDFDFTQLFYISPAYEKIWGQTCQSLYEQPKSFIEAIHPEDKSRVIAVLEQQRQTGFSHEYRIVQPDGSIRWIWERASTVNDLAGNPYRVVGISQDITERKQTEEALQLADFSFDRSALSAVWIGSDARILRVNEGACQMLGYSREELQSKYVYQLDPHFPVEVWPEHWQMLQQQKTMTITSQLQRKDGSLIPIETTLNYLEFNGKEYNFAFARDISERLQAEAAMRYQREQEQVIVSITQQIRQSLNLEEILNGTVTAVREFLRSDRVIIYRLDTEIGGYVIAESVEAGWTSTSGTVIKDCYFTETYAQLYQQGRVQAVDDIYTAALTPCHVDLLARFQVKANLAVPISQENGLWGLLVVQQCSAPRQWQLLEVDLLRQLATQVAIAIQQSELYQQAQFEITQRQQAEAALQQQAEREKLLRVITQRIRQSLDPTDVLRTTVTEVRQSLQADRVIIFRFNPDWSGSVTVESVSSPWRSILGEHIYDPCFTQTYIQPYQQGRVRAIEDISLAGLKQCYVDLLTQFQVRANLVVPILQNAHLWGLLIVHQCSRPREWQPDEVELLQQLSTHVAIALQQSELYQQAQAEIAQRQLAEAALRQQSDHERLITDITNRIRQSLDLDDVLSVTVDEVRQVLEADRVLVFRLHLDGSGSIVKEAVLPEYPVTKEMRWLDECFPAECYEFYRQGKARIVPNVVTDDWGACLAEFMQSIKVKSKIVAPIIQTTEESNETRVWGLLIAHACTYQRQWQPMEAELLQRLTDKLAIAIQQAELHQQVQQLNANLEVQVQERTLELQQALKFEALLKRITDKVRDSLDEAQILQTAVQELALGLKVQCCDTALYDFEQASSTIRCEYITSGIPVAKGQSFMFSNLPEVYEQLLQGQYVQFSMIVPLAAWRANITPRFTILSCPLMDDQGVLGDLWLFRPQESSFNALEVRLVEQVANQCAIALRQSRLYQTAQTQVSELERLNRLKDDFLSTVSHELRSPMSNIKMAIQMLEVMQPQVTASNPEHDRTSRYFNILRNECQREISLINDLLDLTRLDAETEPLNLTTIELQSWIPRMLEPFEHRICSQQQQLQSCIPTSLPPLTTDLSYLERTFTELLNNACKYTPAGGQITVSVEALPGDGEAPDRKNLASSFSIMVCNSGVEIPSSELERIFDKFYRIPNNDPWKHGGTGLGLALVKRLVEGINGNIVASSHHQQTIFTIQLPSLNHES